MTSCSAEATIPVGVGASEVEALEEALDELQLKEELEVEVVEVELEVDQVEELEEDQLLVVSGACQVEVVFGSSLVVVGSD